MGQKIKKLKKIRLHREGTDQLVGGAIALVAIAAILWGTFDNKIPFWIFLVVFGVVYCIVLNFYRCPIRYLNVEDTEKLVVAPWSVTAIPFMPSLMALSTRCGILD